MPSQAAFPLPVDIHLSGDTPEEIAATARAAEEAGLAGVWCPELHRSATISLAVAAAATERITLGTGIALAFTRSPMTLALEAMDLDELSDGRLALGLGAGVRRLNQRWHGAPYDPPVRRMRELIAAVRELIAAMAEGRDARSPGRLYDIAVVGFRRPGGGRRARIPVWLAAVLPGMTGLAGEVADGFLDHPITTPEWLEEVTLPSLRAGAARAGRDAPALAAAMICAASDTDPEGALRAAALTVGFYATVRTYEPLFQLHGFDARLPAIRTAFMDRAEPARLAEVVGEDMARAFAAAGTSAEVRDRAGVYADRADRLWAATPHHLQDGDAVRRWQGGIRDAFGHPAR